MEDLKNYLSLSGHDVEAISARRQTPTGGKSVLRPKRFQDLTGYDFILPLKTTLRKEKFDIVQSLHFTDGYAAVTEAKHVGHRTSFYVTGPPFPGAVRRLPPDRWLLRQAITRADRVLVPSNYVAGIVSEFYGVEADVIPVPIDTTTFDTGEVSEGPPTILCVAAFDDRRKGVRPLVRAFTLLRKHIPDLRLVLSGQMNRELRSELETMLSTGVRPSVDFLGVGKLEDLPRLYQRASVTVLPSKWESYSLVLLESWACGCPVVAAAHGALPELVDDPETGILFDCGGDGIEVQDIEALSGAIEKGLSLRSRPHTSELCRRKAENFCWERLGPAFITAYRELIA